MFELNGYQMPDFPESRYPYAMVSLDSSGGCAYLTFTDKVGYIKKVIVDNVWYGNAYTLGLTADAAYDESKVIYEESYVVMLDEACKDALELLYPGISKTAWLQYKPSSLQTPSGGYYSIAMNYGPQWSNVTLYDEDGNLFLSAGKKFPLQGWLNWHVIGLCSRPLPLSKREPVDYLYNGVRLPDINTVWTDKEALPYARIAPPNPNVGPYYIMTLTESPARVDSKNNKVWFGTGRQEKFEAIDGKWVHWNSGIINYDMEYLLSSNPILWSSYAIYDADGTIYPVKSDPIPVYE